MYRTAPRGVLDTNESVTHSRFSLGVVLCRPASLVAAGWGCAVCVPLCVSLWYWYEMLVCPSGTGTKCSYHGLVDEVRMKGSRECDDMPKATVL